MLNCLILVTMGYADKLQRLCGLRGIDQTALAARVGLSKSTISRIMSGLQEPKLSLALNLANVLGVSLDFLANDQQEFDSAASWVRLTDEELEVLRIVRRLGTETSTDRLLVVPGQSSHSEQNR